MGNIIFKNIIRAVLLILLQGVVLKGLVIDFPPFQHLNIFIYPIIFIILPMAVPMSVQLVISFVVGTSIDFFYNTPGVHAAASVAAAFIRPVVLRLLEPRGGYTVDGSPTAHTYGQSWFITFVSILLGLHLFILFSIQVFTFYYIIDILLKTLLSFAGSILFIMFYMLLFNPKY